MSDSDIVREGLAYFGALGGPTEAALDALVAERDMARVERDMAREEWYAYREQQRSTDSRWQAAEAERDEALTQANAAEDHFAVLWAEKQAAEAENARLREALRLIETHDTDDFGYSTAAANTARAALANEEKPA